MSNKIFDFRNDTFFSKKDELWSNVVDSYNIKDEIVLSSWNIAKIWVIISKSISLIFNQNLPIEFIIVPNKGYPYTFQAGMG